MQSRKSKKEIQLKQWFFFFKERLKLVFSQVFFFFFFFFFRRDIIPTPSELTVTFAGDAILEERTFLMTILAKVEKTHRANLST